MIKKNYLNVKQYLETHIFVTKTVCFPLSPQCLSTSGHTERGMDYQQLLLSLTMQLQSLLVIQ